MLAALLCNIPQSQPIPDAPRYGPALSEEERRRWFSPQGELSRRRREKEHADRVTFGVLPAPKAEQKAAQPQPIVAREAVIYAPQPRANIAPLLDNIARAALEKINDDDTDDIIAIMLLH